MRLEALTPLNGVFGQVNSIDGPTNYSLTELSDIGAVVCSCVDVDAGMPKKLEKVLGCALPTAHGVTVEAGGRRAIWLTPRSWLILCGLEDESNLVDAVGKRYPDRTVHANRFSDALGWLCVEGEAVEDLLRQGSFLTFDPAGLPIGFAKRTPIAGIPAVVLRKSENTWTIGVERSRTHYFVKWLTKLTQNFSGDRL